MTKIPLTFGVSNHKPMKTTNLIRAAILGIICIILLNACYHTRPKINDINPAFGQYISGFTSGMVSRKTTLRIELARGLNETKNGNVLLAGNSNSINPANLLPEASLLNGIFSFDPEIKGKAVWINDRVIEFIPEKVLPVNQFYNVDFNLGKVADVPNEFKNFRYQFSTYPQNLFVNVDGLRAYDDYNTEWQQVSGKITTSDYEDTALIRKTISVVHNGKSKRVKINYSYRNNEFYFHADSIVRGVTQSTVTISWNGEALNTISNGKKEIIVPAMGDFSVTEARVVDNEDQYLELNFSDPIKYNQNLNGIITIKGVDNLTYAIEGNIVKVFLPYRIEGDKLITVNTGIKNFKGYKMNEAFNQTISFEEPKPLVRIKGNGTILPNSNGLIFPFEAISLKAVDVRVIKIFENNVHQFLQTNGLDGEDGLTRVGKIVAEKKITLNYNKSVNLKQWNKHVIDLGKLINPDPGAIYRISIKFKKEYAVCDCESTENETNQETNPQSEKKNDDENWNENNWNHYGFNGGYDHWYYYDENYSPCDENYYYGKAVSRNILASNLGIIYKLEDNKLSHVFISDMISAKPIEGATVEYYDYTRQFIASGITDKEGMADIKLNQKPFLLVAKHGKQRGYLKLLDGYTNSLSKFDIEGEVVQKGIKGFIFGERGVWRPGDSLYITFIMEDKEKRLPPNHPVKFELHDPNGQVIYQVSKTKNINGMYDFRTATSYEAPTGNYMATIKVGNRTFNQTLKIETVKPNRLKIYMEFPEEKLSDNKKDSTAKLQVKWLHGAIAGNLHALVNANVSQTKTVFEKYNSFTFDSPLRNFHSEGEVIFDGYLNDKGEAQIKTVLQTGKTAPGMLRATYITKVFEEGGDFSIDRYSTLYSPYNTYIGLRTPETKEYDNMLETNQDYTFEVASLNKNGKPVNANKLQVKIYKMQWRWWFEKNEEDLAGFVSRAGTIVVKDTIIKTLNGKGLFNFKVNYPEYGRYLITVSDLEGGHETGKIVYIDWPYLSRSNRSGTGENASMLNFSCDKEKYTSGETVKLSFPSPANGMALVSIETGSKVVKKFWVPTSAGETVYEFKSTGEMAPNAYIHVTLIQPHAGTKNDLPIRMYGIVPILVDNPQTHLFPSVTMADVIKPESKTNIKIKEKNGKKMNYTIAMVDEGLLDLTRFKTPQPWNTFYAREALGVKTWDMYDAVIGAYSGKLDKLLSIGGDGEGLENKSVKANRFKPMVKFAGPFTLEAGQEKTHVMDIPNYVGSVRVMVIAEDAGAYGSTEKTVAVRKPLMLLATLPRVLGPGESVFLPVNIFAMEKHVKDVKVEVEVNELLSIDGVNNRSLKFNQTGDEVINFKLNVAEKTGIAKVKITATSGNEKTFQEIELDIRTPNPKVSEGFEMVLEPGKEWNTEIAFKGITGTNKATIEFSSIPAMGLEKRLDYLIQYPHGCIEQTTSSVFPQLYVMGLIDMKEQQKEKISKNIKAGLKRLQLFQTVNGGFAYWPGETYESEWGTNYAGHFMIEAENQGYSIPNNMKQKWIKYQQQQARNWTDNNGMYTHPHGKETNQAIQAYRLYVLAISGNAEMGAMNRLREEKNLSATAKWRLASAYKVAGQSEVALNLIQGLPTSVKPYKELSYSYGSDLRDEAMILESLSLLNQKDKAGHLASQIAKALGTDNWMSTQETAYSLLAMCQYAGVKANSELEFSYSLNSGEVKKQSAKKTMLQIKYSDNDFSGKTPVYLKNNGKNTLFAKIIVEGVPLTGDKTASAKNLSITVTYKNMKGQEIQPGKIQQGSDFIAEVKISNPGTKGFLSEMALSQIFPSGWEIHNSRMDESETGSSARYQDIRDDRIYTYYDLAPNTSKTFVVQLNATYLGRFYLPTIYTEAMYDNTINARLPGQWVEVVKDMGIMVNK